MKRLLISVALILLSLNINAAISQSGITNLKQLNGNQITELISGNTLTGYISEGQFQGKIAVTYGENGSLVMFYVPDDKLYYGKWKVAYLASGGEGNCTKGFDVPSYTCYYWFTGIKDGSKYAYVKRNGQIIFQFHKVESANNQKVKINSVKEKEIKEGDYWEDVAKWAGFENYEEFKKDSDDRYYAKQKAEKDAYAKKKKEREQSKTPNSELLNSYVDYMVIKNIYEGSSYYVSYSQMKQVEAVTKSIESYYRNSVSSTDSIWNSAVSSYEMKYAGKINSMNSFSAFNSEFSGFVDLYIMGINSRANRLGISISNTVKDF